MMSVCRPAGPDYLVIMTKRTSPKSARQVLDARDLEDAVHDKREGWRASSTAARRRQRRYKKMLTQHLMRREASDGAPWDLDEADFADTDDR